MTTIINPGGPNIPFLILHDPGPLVECRASQLSWAGNIGDTGILVYRANTIPEGNPLEFLPTVPGALTTTTWLVDQPGGLNYTLLLHDSTAASSTVFVSVALNPDGDTSCDRKDQPLDPPGTSTAGGGSSTTTPSGTVQPTSTTSTTSDQSSVSPSSPGPSSSTSLPPTSSLTGLPSTDISPTQASSSVSDHHHHASVVGPIVGAVFALLIVGGLGGLFYMRRRKRLRMRISERPMSGEINAFEVPRPVAKRPLVIMEAEPPASTQQPLASLREENNVLGEENAVLRAVIARMQTSLPVPGDSETLPSYESRPVRS